jgi:hypothetical protein
MNLVDEVLVRVGHRDLSVLDWPPISLVHQLAYRVKRVRLGGAHAGPSGEVVDVIRCTDKLGYGGAATGCNGTGCS